MADLIVDFPAAARVGHGDLLHERPRRRVSFSDGVEIRFVECLADAELCPDLWYDDRDFKLFKAHTAAVMSAVRARGLTMAGFAERHVGDTSAFLGLEGYLSESTPRDILMRRRAVRLAVLFEQLRQRESGTDDPEAMARIAVAETAVSVRRSRIIALLHADKR